MFRSVCRDQKSVKGGKAVLQRNNGINGSINVSEV